MLPNGSNSPPISMADINGPAGFNGRGNNLNAYRGTLFYRPDNSTGFFPSGAINFSDFYLTQGSSPVVPGSATYTSGSSIILPSMFNKLYVTCYGGGGGGGGGGRVRDNNPNAPNIGNGGSGGAGQSTVFYPNSAYAVTGPGGGGGGGGGASFVSYLQSGGVDYPVGSGSGTGSTGAAGSGGGGGAGGGGGVGSGSGTYVTSGATYTSYTGASGGSGGAGGNSGEVLVMDIDSMGWSTIRNFYGVSVPVSIGGGGGGGAAGSVGGVFSGVGSPGSSGRIFIRWT